MQIRVEREQGSALAQAVDSLLSKEPYLAYANFAAIAGRDGALLSVHRQHRLRSASNIDTLVARDESGQPLASLSIEPRTFESEHFGMRIGKIDPIIGVGGESLRAGALRSLYAAAFDVMRAQGYDYVTAAASTDDRVAGWILQELQAFYVGTKISWMQPLTGAAYAHRLPDNLRLEVYEHPTQNTLARASWQRLWEWSGRAFDRGPLVFDRNLPLARSTAVYQVWTEKALTGEWAEVLLVVRDGDEIVGFHTMMLLRELSDAAGVGILGRGIGGTLPEYRGLFTTLQRETCARRPLGGAFLENETQASNVQSIHVFGKLGHQCIRSTASFHRRL